jgi:hypothetical protein
LPNEGITSFSTTLLTSRCARLNTRKPNAATVQTPPEISRVTPLLTNDSDQPYEELIQRCRPFSDGQGHPFQVVLEEDARYAVAMLERPAVFRHSILRRNETASRGIDVGRRNHSEEVLEDGES